MLSIIIPSYKDPLLKKTVESLLENAEGEIEIICVLDGYWTEPVADKRVKVIHLGKNRGMREAINAGVAISKGEYLMRTDEHCTFGKGFDRIILETIQDNWIVVPRHYKLDTEKWEVMPDAPIDYNKLVISHTHNKFSGQEWRSRAKERKDIMIDETMAMQGSCWFMKRSWWDKVIKELQTEGYGPHYGDSTEMVFKTWKAGGKLMVNKNTWFAHRHRDFPRTHNYPRAKAKPEWQYALNLWGNYYQEIKEKWKI